MQLYCTCKALLMLVCILCSPVCRTNFHLSVGFCLIMFHTISSSCKYLNITKHTKHQKYPPLSPQKLYFRFPSINILLTNVLLLMCLSLIKHLLVEGYHINQQTKCFISDYKMAVPISPWNIPQSGVNPTLPLYSMYSTLQHKIDSLQDQIDFTQSYVKMISEESSSASLLSAPSISSKQSQAQPPTEAAYLVQLPQSLVLAMIAVVISGILYTAITRLAIIADCTHTRHLRDGDTRSNSRFLKVPTTDTSDTPHVSSVRTLSQLHGAVCTVLTRPLLASQVIVWAPITTLAIINGLLVTEIQMLDREDQAGEEDYSDYELELEFEDAEVIRIQKLLKGEHW